MVFIENSPLVQCGFINAAGPPSRVERGAALAFGRDWALKVERLERIPNSLRVGLLLLCAYRS
jgi:hypothetical protein